MDVQEPFFFERTSVPDDRCPQPVGPPKWELMAPIIAEDVDQSLKGMKDGVPGPDGLKLKDVSRTNSSDGSSLQSVATIRLPTEYIERRQDRVAPKGVRSRCP